ncbi:MAG: hypothetical protein ABJH68_00990 [Ilumatobacter sp.]|uniref:hypothetical protein n=1 Tax=Ilumatobacter sp. TaxID=1967498 RepID=UPI003296FF78
MGEERAPSRWWGLTALVPLVPFLAIGAFVPPGYLSRLYFAGTPDRWVYAARGGGAAGGWFVYAPGSETTIDSVDLSDARIALVLDLVFLSSFAVVGFLLLRTGHRYWAPMRRRGDRFIWRHMAIAAVAAGVLDLIETGAQLIWIDSLPPTIVTHAVAAIAWWKWIAYLVALVGLLGLVIGPGLAPVIRPTMRRILGLADGALGVPPAPTRRADDVSDHVPGEVLGITCSGGGIRSAAVMIGAFRGLSGTGTFQRARWLHAVSGGGFTAGGWRATSHRDGRVDLFGEDDPWFRHVRERRRYLDNGVGSIVGGAVGAAARTVVVLGSVVSGAVLVGWLAGRLTRNWSVHPGFSNGEGTATSLSSLLAWRLVLPGLIPVVFAGIVFLLSRTTYDTRTRARATAVITLAGGVGGLLLVALVAVPVGIRYGRPVLSLLRNGSAETNAGVLGLLSAVGLITAIQKLLTAQIKKRWSRLGGVALGVGLLLLAGKVADDQANLERFFRGSWVPAVAVAWLVVVDVLPSHRLTLNGVYRKRLAETFLPGIRYADEPLWAEYRNDPGPELVLCGTAHSSTLQAGGLPALGFSFRAAGVTLHDGASAQWIGYPGGSSWEGYPRSWVVSRSMALAGAAFASAMGRQSYGTTNSLLAAVNFRLGMWVPNPKRADWFIDRDRSPRIHLGYFVKELFNRYDPDDDAFLYVADGGHRDNLGFVEQLRERPDRIIVLDASGDRPGGFGTMKGAIELADVELDVQVDIDWKPVEWRDRDVAIDCVTTGVASFREGPDRRVVHRTRLIYAKAQISDTAPSELRQFAAANPPFPDYSTGDQYLSEVEFDLLVAMGEHLASRIESILDDRS